jgi:anti-anti-sigma regulatory factor
MPDASRRPHRFILEPIQTLRAIEATCTELRDLLAQHTSIEIDCSAVDEADLTLVQLLLAARKSAARSGKRLALAAPASGALRNALLRSGLLDGPAPEGSARSFWHHPSEAP